MKTRQLPPDASKSRLTEWTISTVIATQGKRGQQEGAYVVEFSFDALNTKTILGLLAPAIAIANFVYYMVGIVRGKTVPNFYTWLIWGMVMGIAAVAQMEAGAGAGAWMTLAGSALAFTRALAALCVGRAETSKGDQACLLACMMAIVVWRLTGNALLAVVIVTLIDLAAFYPAARQAWHKPWQEDAGTYALFALQFGLSFAALESYNFITMLYPLAIIFGSLAFTAFILWRRYVLAAARPVRHGRQH